MAKREFQLTSNELSELFRAYDAQEQRRWQAVRLYGDRWAMNDLEAITGCSESSIRRWTRQYQQGDRCFAFAMAGGNRARID
jgi:hypothetical protein